MKILICTNVFHPNQGGPYVFIRNLAEALALRGESILIFTVDYTHLPAEPPPLGVSVTSIPSKLIPVLRQSWIPGCSKYLDEQIKAFKPDIIHNNSLWLSLNHYVARAARRDRIPLVHSPHGCLEPWAYQYRRWKKDLAMRLYQRRDLESVTCFHAASVLEAESIRRMGFGQPIAVIPNGIELPEWAAGDGRWEIGGEDEHRTSNIEHRTLKSRYALFLGRLHPIKNLPTLLRAWAKVKPEGWVLRLAGSDEVGHRAELEALARELGIQDRVEFLGPMYGKDKEELFRSSELAFLVSHSENFGIAAAEALGWGLPVIASKSTPWKCLVEENIGWWVDGSPEGIRGAIEEFLSKSDGEREKMRYGAIKYADQNFGWSSIAQQFRETYAGLI